jgi:ADP-heptose:LPS heptosyltransferase
VPPGLWLEAARILAKRTPLAFVLCAGPGEEETLEVLARALGGPRVAVLRQPAALLPELLAHTAETRLVWCGDSGPRHLARALRRAALVVAGPTDPRHCALGERERLVRAQVPCGPCHRERCALAAPELLQCYGRISPAALASASEELLALPLVTMDG